MAATTLESSSTERFASGYRPHLDGLRALAVYLVVLFHAGVDRLSGGFIGVDVFFVLSGYLVTQVLVRTLRLGPRRDGGPDRPAGFSRFYARRYRRLLPASFVTLIVTAIVYSAIASQAELASAIGSFKATFLYVANWYFIRQSSDYFAAAVNSNPVQQFWSLAVEEQFYFVWPILLTGLFLATRGLRRHAHRARQVAIAAAALLSVAWALHLAGSNVSRAYYGTDARAYQLLAGALLALTPGLVLRASRWRPTWFAAPAGVVALVVLSTSRLDVNPVKRGIGATVATLVLIVGLESLACGPLNRVFSSQPAVYLGRVSYGTYLWHWPVILVAASLTDHSISPFSTFAIAAFVATGLASISYQLLEMPVRRQPLLDRISPAVILAGIAISVVGALVLIPTIIDPYASTRRTVGTTASATGLTPVPNLDFASARTDVGDLKGAALRENCYQQPVSVCTPVHGRGAHILVIGDSHAQMMAPTFAKLAQEHGLTFSTAASGACPWQRNLYIRPVIASDQVFLERCLAFKRDLYERVIPALKPDVVVAWSNDYLTRRPGVVYDADGHPASSSGAADLARQVKAETERSIAELERYASKVLIAEPVPTAPTGLDPFQCLTKSKWVEPCRFVADAKPTVLDLVYRSVADDRRVYEASFDRFACPFMPICDPVSGGMIVRFDNQHLTPRYAVSLAAPMAQFLQANQLIGR